MRQDDMRPGEVWQVAPLLRGVLAPNPSAMTGPGTTTWLLGRQSLCVIDPGPALPAHLDALLAAIGRAEVSHIVVTHSHLDHSGLAPALSAATGAPVLARGDSKTGRSAFMQRLAEAGALPQGEGVDHRFRPDAPLRDGEELRGQDWSLRVIHTPGHMGNHVSLRWQDTIFCGDHVMGWASTLVAPPDGDLGDFLASCARLRAEGARLLLPAHGAAIMDPAARIDWLVAHRAARDAQIAEALGDGAATAGTLARRIYGGTPDVLMPAAALSVLAHLTEMARTDRAEALPYLSADATFRRT